MSVFLLILAALGVVLVSLVRRWRLLSAMWGIPGPRPLPPFGNALEFGNSRNIMNVLSGYLKEYKGFAKIYIGIEPNLLVSDYEMLKFLFTSTKILNKSNVYDFLYRWIGTGLLTAKAERWKKHRKIITPTFHFQILEQFINIFDSNSTIMVEKLRPQVGKTSVDIFPFVTLCTLDIICETAMGTTVNAQENSESDYVKSVKEMCRITNDRGWSPVEQYEFLYYFTKNYRIEKKSLRILHDYTESVIKAKKELYTKGSLSVADAEGVKRKKAFLDLLLEASMEQNLLTDQEIREEVDTFMFEGHDTTASATSFLLYNLASYPEIQEKVFQEQKRIFKDDFSRPITSSDLQNMKYLEMAIKENLRLYPSVPIIARQVSEDNREYKGILLPKGLNIIICLYDTLRNPDLFPNPDTFDPERFTQDHKPLAYIPFSAGPRNCIGQKYAMLEMKSIASKIIRNYQLHPVPGHKLVLQAETVLKSETGMRIRLQNRNPW